MISSWVLEPELAWQLHAECPDACVLFQAVRDDVGALLDFQWTAFNPAAKALVDGLGLGRAMSAWGEGLKGLPERNALGQVVDKGEPLSFEVQGCLGGAERWYRARAVKCGDGFSLWLTDITEVYAERRSLREAEERYRLAAWATNDVLCDWNLASEHIHWGEASHLVLGYPPEEMGGISWWEQQLHPDDREMVLRSLHLVVESGGESWMAEYRFRHKDGTYVHMLDRRLVARDARGCARRMVGSMMDITERKRAVERMQEEAEFRERFIGILGHDLRNPLNAISLSARAMRRYGTLSPVQQQQAQRIEASAARIGNMISDILDLTRVRQSWGLPLNMVPTSLPAVCRQVVEELTVAHPERPITVEVEGPGEGVWDPERLAQVVSNLVGNALEHGEREGPVFVRCRGTAERQVLEISNPGTPIPSHLLATLFDPFRQGGTGRGGRSSGLGLGLFIVREIVEAHWGHVTVRSAENEGTAFTVSLPRDSRRPQE